MDARYVELLQSMDYYREYNNLLLVHAGFNLDREDPFADQEAMLWIRYGDRKVPQTWLEDRIIVHGHTPHSQRHIRRQVNRRTKHPIIGIDNGCVYRRVGMNHLCALELDTMELVFERNID